jgi:hypothetical protein
MREEFECTSYTVGMRVGMFTAGVSGSAIKPVPREWPCEPVREGRCAFSSQVCNV